jgi:uncharacterized protein (DUF1015 family)
MAEVKPFKGVLYNTKQINDLAEVIAPPYDVISTSYQDNLYQRHPHNVIRLILGKSEPEDTDTNDLHKRSANHFRQWLTDDILIHDTAEAFDWNRLTRALSYPTSVRFLRSSPSA